MTSSRRAALSLLLLCAAAGASIGLARAAESTLRVGVLSDIFPFGFKNDAGELDGVEPKLISTICDAIGANCTMTVLADLDSRITALQDGDVDVVIAGFSVTPEREELLNFVRPFYYAAGIGLYALEGTTLQGWESIRGKKVCAQEGYYGNSEVASSHGPELVVSATADDVVANLVAGKCVAAITDTPAVSIGYVASQLDTPQTLVAVPGAPAVLKAPYGIAVAKNNTQLQDWISGALTRTALSSGSDSLIYDLQDEFIVANGGSPEADLEDVTNAITYFIAPPTEG